jgi:hypothetical protein
VSRGEAARAAFLLAILAIGALWLAPPVDGADPVTVRMDVEGSRGTLHAHLARATPLAACRASCWLPPRND